LKGKGKLGKRKRNRGGGGVRKQNGSISLFRVSKMTGCTTAVGLVQKHVCNGERARRPHRRREHLGGIALGGNNASKPREGERKSNLEVG